MLGSAIGKGDDAATFTKKEKKGVLMSSTLKVLVQGSLGTTTIMELNRNRRRSRSSSELFLDYLRKMKKEARTLTGEQDRMFASAASAKRRAELAGRDASLALSIPTTGNTQEANLTGYLSRKTGGSFHYSVKPSTSVKDFKY
jgi:hypothetical protein